MKLHVLIAAAAIALSMPSTSVAIDVLAPLDLSKVEFGSALELVRDAYPEFVDHETDSGSAIRSDKLEWFGIQVGCIIWFDDRDALKSILLTIAPNAQDGVKSSFDRLREKLVEAHGKPTAKDLRDSGYTRLEWHLESSSLSFAFIPAGSQIPEHAILSYRAPRTTEAEQAGDGQARSRSESIDDPDSKP